MLIMKSIAVFIAALLVPPGAAQAQTVKVGIIAPFSGPFAHYGTLFRAGAEAYVASQGGKHPNVDAFEGQGGDKGPSGTVRGRSVQPSGVVKFEHDLAQTVGGKLFA